jgi:SHS2 domain-containing protein
MFMGKYKLFGTTADVGVRSEGPGIKEAFEAQAAGMFSIMVDMRGVRAVDSFEISVGSEGGGYVELLAAWLEELLYISDVRQVFLREFEITKVEAGRLAATVKGEEIDPSRHVMKTPVKAVTYHKMKVERTGTGVKTTVVYDI